MGRAFEGLLIEDRKPAPEPGGEDRILTGSNYPVVQILPLKPFDAASSSLRACLIRGIYEGPEGSPAVSGPVGDSRAGLGIEPVILPVETVSSLEGGELHRNDGLESRAHLGAGRRVLGQTI